MLRSIRPMRVFRKGGRNHDLRLIAPTTSTPSPLFTEAPGVPGGFFVGRGNQGG
jgi:hypothetical protein